MAGEIIGGLCRASASGVYTALGSSALPSWFLAELCPALGRGLRVCWIDAGNGFDAYGLGRTARALGFDPRRVLANVRLARPFNVFQLETIEPMPDDFYERFELGPETLAGELYDVRFKGDTIGFPSNPVWYESIVAVPIFRGHQVVEMKLYPIEMGHERPRSQRGTPRFADDELAKKIIDRLKSLSEPFGTDIELENGIGVWRAPASSNN